MNGFKSFLTTYTQLIDSHLCNLAQLLQLSSDIATEYNEAKEHKFNPGFNVFRLTSDLYYRENFHSDIIKAFLDPSEKHGERTLFLNILIDALNKHFPDKKRIKISDFADATTKREDGRLDIVIMSESTKHCIIIENKINNAGDMPRQLPRYYDYMTQRGFNVDAMIYLPLARTKHPDTSSWTAKDKENVIPVLYHLPAFTTDGTPNLVDSWITSCSIRTNNIDCHSILRQYGNLIKSLNINTMDKIIVSKFYNTLCEGENLESALSIKALLDDIPIIMAERLYNALQHLNPFGNVWLGYRPNFCGLILNVKDRQYKIDTYSSTNGYEIYLFPNENPRTGDIPWADTMESLKNGIRQDNGEYVFKFTFHQEHEAVRFITELVTAAKDYNDRRE